VAVSPVQPASGSVPLPCGSLGLVILTIPVPGSGLETQPPLRRFGTPCSFLFTHRARESQASSPRADLPAG